MQLPLDAQDAPYREKYLDETPTFAEWFIFGSSRCGRLVDISDGTQDVIVKCPLDLANLLIEKRKTFCTAIQRAFALQDLDTEARPAEPVPIAVPEGPHLRGELIDAALSYIHAGINITHPNRDTPPTMWPWKPELYQPDDDVSLNLAKAINLLASEISRRERMKAIHDAYSHFLGGVMAIAPEFYAQALNAIAQRVGVPNDNRFRQEVRAVAEQMPCDLD